LICRWNLLFKAHVEPEIVEQWMGTKVLKLENKKHGGWQFETSDAKGKCGVSGPMGLFTSLFPTKRSHGHLKWRILPFPFNWSF
jgi:hypothetical protein